MHAVYATGQIRSYRCAWCLYA